MYSALASSSSPAADASAMARRTEWLLSVASNLIQGNGPIISGVNVAPNTFGNPTYDDPRPFEVPQSNNTLAHITNPVNIGNGPSVADLPQTKSSGSQGFNWRLVNTIANDSNISSVEISPNTSVLHSNVDKQQIGTATTDAMISPEAEAAMFIQKWRSASLSGLAIPSDNNNYNRPSKMYCTTLYNNNNNIREGHNMALKENIPPEGSLASVNANSRTLPTPRPPQMSNRKIQVTLCRCGDKKLSSSNQTDDKKVLECATSTDLSGLVPSPSTSRASRSSLTQSETVKHFLFSVSSGQPHLYTKGASLVHVIDSAIDRLSDIQREHTTSTLHQSKVEEQDISEIIACALRRTGADHTNVKHSACQTQMTIESLGLLEDEVRSLRNQHASEQSRFQELHARLVERDCQLDKVNAALEELSSQLLDIKVSQKILLSEIEKERSLAAASATAAAALKEDFRSTLAAERAKVAVYLQTVETQIGLVGLEGDWKVSPSKPLLLLPNADAVATAPPSPTSQHHLADRSLNNDFQSPPRHQTMQHFAPLTIEKEKAHLETNNEAVDRSSYHEPLNTSTALMSPLLSSLLASKWAAVEEHLRAIEAQYQARWEATEKRVLASITGKSETKSPHLVSATIELALCQRDNEKKEATIDALREALQAQSEANAKATWLAQESHLAEMEALNKAIKELQRTLSNLIAAAVVIEEETKARWQVIGCEEEIMWQRILDRSRKERHILLNTNTKFCQTTEWLAARQTMALEGAHSPLSVAPTALITPRTISKQVKFAPANQSLTHQYPMLSNLLTNSKSILKDVSPPSTNRALNIPGGLQFSSPESAFGGTEAYLLEREQKASLMEILHLCDEALA